MVFGPDIPKVKREVFPKPPIKAMLGQVRFPPILRIADMASLAPFQDAIRNEFPDFGPEQQFSFVLGPDGPQSVTTAQAYRFRSPDHAWSVLLATDALTIEADPSVRYTSYDEFAEHFARVWEAVVEHFAPSQIARQGLRYTDHIEGDRPAAEWRKYINEDLLGPLVGAFGEGVAQSVSELRFTRDDGLLVFKHGVLPAGPQQAMGYLLDFDYYIEQPIEEVTGESIMVRFNGYHDVLYAFFRWCVTEDALKEFRGDAEVIGAIPTKKSAPKLGVRGVVLGKTTRPCMDIVASPAASYLLPDLLPVIEGVSFGGSETRGLGGVLIIGDSVIIGRAVREDDIVEQRRWADLGQMMEHLSERVIAIKPVISQALATTASPTPAVVINESQAIETVPADASMQAIASRIRELSGLNDTRLAELFKVTRETFNRWRSGAMANPTEGTRRRVGMVLRLLEELAASDVRIKDWLQNPSASGGLTPYDLLVKGRIDEVAYLAAAIGKPMPTPRGEMDEELLLFEEDDEGWQSFDIEVGDDED